MKKILIALVLGAVAYAGCKKKNNIVSSLVTVSYPVVTITGQQYVSLHVGDPLPTITGVAFDTFYRDSLPVLVDLAGVDNTTPGLYVVKATAKNRYGHLGIAQAYIAVTEVSDALDLSGWYIRDNASGRASQVTKVARGLFTTSNLGGVDTGDAATGAVISAVFAVTSDTTIDLGMQSVNVNGVWTDMGKAGGQTLSLSPGDTVFSYALDLAGFGTQLRSFKKQ